MDKESLNILYLITKSNFGGAIFRQTKYFRNRRFLTLPMVAVFLNGKRPCFPTPSPRPA